jgi:hypothetical protein
VTNAALIEALLRTPALTPAGPHARFLAPPSGYTRRAASAVDKLEAVSEEEQRRLTQQAHRNSDLQLRRQWGEAHEQITRALDDFAAVAPPTLTSSIRAVRRSADQLRRKLA